MSSEKKITAQANPIEIPKEKLADLKERKFNLGKMVEKFVLAKMTYDMLHSQGARDSLYFLGIAQGYADFFNELAIPQSIIQTIIKSLDMKVLEDKVKELVSGGQPNRLIVAGVGTESDLQMISMLKQAFDSKISGK